MIKNLGRYDMGIRVVDLIADSDDFGAHFNLVSRRNKGMTTIHLGMKSIHWGKIVGILTHEITELVLTEMGLRYIPSPDLSEDNGGYLFSMNHTQFSEVTARVGLFLASALPDVRKYFDWLQKKRAAKKK